MKIKLLRTVECDGKQIAGGDIVDDTQATVGQMQSLVGAGWAEVYTGKKLQDLQLDNQLDQDDEDKTLPQKVITEPGKLKVAKLLASKPTSKPAAKPVKKTTPKPARKR